MHTCIAEGTCCVWLCISPLHAFIIVVIDAYDVSLRASKEKEQQLQQQLSTVQVKSQYRKAQLSRLEDENYDQERLITKHVNELQQEDLKRLPQTG